MKLTNETLDILKAFAKQNKISQSKLTSVAEKILEPVSDFREKEYTNQQKQETKMKDQIIDYLVNEGIEITISKDMKPDGYGVYYDLNTQMKSHAHLVFSEDRFKIYKRYDEVCTSPIFTDQYIEIEDVIDFICWEVKDCIYGRDFMSERWEKLLIKRNILTKNVKTTTTVNYI